MKKKLLDFFLAERLEKTTIGEPMVDMAIKLAESLGGYLGGSHRFGLNHKGSDLDLFFLTQDGWEVFCKFLGTYGSQEYFSTPTEEWETRTEKKYPYPGVKRYFHLEEVRVKVRGTDQIHYLKGRYTLGGSTFDVSKVDKFLTPHEEAEIYANKIMDYSLKG